MFRKPVMKMNKPLYHVVSLSGGKDSTAMLLMMIERQMPIDLILFCDTGLDFPEMYKHLDALEKGIDLPITRVRADHTYEYYFLKAPVKRRKETEFSEKFGLSHMGYGWAGPKMRYMSPTSLLMIHDPMTIAMGDEGAMEQAIAVLRECKESIINAYSLKTGISRAKGGQR